MSVCNWDPSKHSGKPCPVHGGSGNPGAGGHKIRINNGKYETKLSEDSDWEEISPEEYSDLREGGYQDFDENVDDDFGFDEEDDYIRAQHILKDPDEYTPEEVEWAEHIDSMFGNDDIDMNISNEEIENQRKAEERAKLDKEYPDRGNPELEKDVNEALDEEKYEPKYKAEDFEDARYYPTESTMDGNRWVGRYRSIADAHGVGNDFKKYREAFKPAGEYNGYSIVQGPDGYYSINPNITSMSFKTREALQDYLDKKNPEEHKYGIYFEPGSDIEQTYRGKNEDGSEYDMEGPDAYKAARTKTNENAFFDSFAKNIEEQPVEKLSELEKDLGYAITQGTISEEKGSELNKMINKKRTTENLKKFGYTQEVIDNMSDEDLDVATDFFARFNNPKVR